MLAKHPDPTVDHVLKTWAPRMIVQGIDHNDLMTTGAHLNSITLEPRNPHFLVLTLVGAILGAGAGVGQRQH